MFRAFSVAAAAAAFVLAVLGSWVRINGAGLTCPDWPLCHGAHIPTLAGGVLLEWGHRLVAFVLAFLIAGALITGWRRRDELALVGQAVPLVAGIFALQVVLGAATVRLANSPPSVVLHWATGMALLAGLVALALLSVVEPPRGRGWPSGPFTLAALGAVAVLAFVTMGFGAYVSSSGAGLACAALPDCGGTLLGTSLAETVQMIHRIAAGMLFVASTIVMYWSIVAASTRVRVAMLAAFALLILQMMLGLANVAWNLPMVLREAHAANAAAVFIACVCALCFGLLDAATDEAPARAGQPQLEAARIR